MSMGPSEGDQKPKAIESISFVAGSTIKRLFTRPAASVFYIGVILLFLALILEGGVPWEYYAVLAVVGFAAAIQSVISHPLVDESLKKGHAK